MKRKPLLVFVLGAVAGLAAAQSSRPGGDAGVVQLRELPLKFPVVGNVDAVRQWRFGRLEEAEATAGTDLWLRIRLADGSTVRVVGPGPALAEMAYRSDWVRSPSKQFPGASDYVERMVAFDYDENFRIIAMASLETINRNRNRLWRVLR